MASSEFILSLIDLESSILSILDEGSRIWYIAGISENLGVVSPENLHDIIHLDSVSTLIKNPIFATDDPVVVNAGRDGIRWIYFKELEGDGHLRFDFKKVSDGEFFYVELKYTSFFVKRNGEYISQSVEMINIYRRIRRYILNKSSRISFGMRDVFVSKAILEERRGVVSEFNYLFGIPCSSPSYDSRLPLGRA